MPTPTPTATSTLTARQEYYLERNWAFEPDMLPTPTPWPRTLPCQMDQEFPEMEAWVIHWAEWIERYRERGWHDVPLEIGLAVIMHESRGNPNAFSCSGAIGVFQLLARDAVIPIPGTCAQGESGRRTFEGNYPTAILLQSSKNIRIGLDHLEDYTWQARAYLEGKDRPDYRSDQTIAVPEAADLDWWFTEEGYITLAMNQCGPTGYREDRCGRLGGDVYAADILECWVPWVQDVLGINHVCAESAFMIQLRQQVLNPPSYINLSRREMK